MRFSSLSFQISGLKPLEKMRQFLICLLMWHLTGVFGDEVKSVSVMEGDSVTLHTDTKLQRDDLILWRFGPQGSLIARINRAANMISIYDDVLDGRFRDRLQVNDQTGDLTITNITTQHTGLYQIIISSKLKISYRFNVIVYAHLPAPVIIRDSCSSSNCMLLCSVLNVRDVSLSWYKGNSLLSIISVSDLNIRLSLPLEVEYQDTNTYRCVLNNTITNQTQHLNITQLCQTCSGVFGDEVKSVSVMEGDSLTLYADITEIKTDDLILWRFGPQETRIAKINKAANKISIYDDVLDGRFRDRLQLNNQTGDLTITNITTQHTGLYQITINSVRQISYRFNVIVYAHLPVPVITRDSCSSSKCVLLCSVLNMRDVSLSWYKGNSLLSIISVSDLSIRLSLPLEVEYQDTNTYSCVVNNPITNQTQHLNITDVCQPCSDSCQ
ncbi:T-lymphocyte surface antigen Ly-9-like [Paramisgurnus dabryanus]|uniref:T-lymphocyte surface antigen Ly-9-like n=1 Tax=Paramisgurnus dabryanus TaxID=90735 RepID=UPI0031F40556